MIILFFSNSSGGTESYYFPQVGFVDFKDSIDIAVLSDNIGYVDASVLIDYKSFQDASDLIDYRRRDFGIFDQPGITFDQVGLTFDDFIGEV